MKRRMYLVHNETWELAPSWVQLISRLATRWPTCFMCRSIRLRVLLAQYTWTSRPLSDDRGRK